MDGTPIWVDNDHPLIVTRNYVQADLNKVADSSINGNSGLWVVSAQQNAGQGVPTGSFTDLTPGGQAPDAVNNEVRLPAGSICRVFNSSTDTGVGGNNSIRLVSIPRNTIIGLALSGSTLTATYVNNDTVEINLPSGGGGGGASTIADVTGLQDALDSKQDKIENDDGSDPEEGQIAIVDSAGKLVLGTAPSGGGSGATTFDG